jgi:hypothetical protein
MRLSEFADPSSYTLSTDDAANFLKQLERVWSRDDCISVWRRSFLALCVGYNIGGTLRRIGHRAV